MRQFKSVGDWSKWLAQGDRPEQLEGLRRHVERGLPCGAEGFIRRKRGVSLPGFFVPFFAGADPPATLTKAFIPRLQKGRDL